MDFKDLDIWKKTRVLTNDVYTITKKFPKDEIYGLTNQIRRCAVSVPSNIAEGIGRKTSKDTIHFLYIARGSLFELETQLFLSFDQQYITEFELDQFLLKVVDCKKLINGLINYYQKLIES